jgi:hypothetical protein
MPFGYQPAADSPAGMALAIEAAYIYRLPVYPPNPNG